MKDPGETFFRYFIVGATLIIALIFFGIIVSLVFALWQTGFITFTIVSGLIWGFCWVVYKLANSDFVKNWTDDL